MKFCKKMKKLFFGYPFLLGLLTALLINFGGHWMVRVRELTFSEASYTIVAKSSVDIANSDNDNDNGNNNNEGGNNPDQENRDIIVSEAEVPVLDYDPGSYMI
jgi:hypothetical protein